MKTLAPWVLAGCLMLAALPARATVTGADLLQRCAAHEKSIAGGTLSTEEGLDAMWCMGYVSGLLDGMGVADFRIGDTRAICPPQQGISRTEALRAILHWLREHPAEQNKSGRRGAVLALAQALPCAAPVSQPAR